MNKIDLSKIHDISEMKEAVREAGSYYFSPDTMRFFNSRVYSGILHTEGGIVFITSEKYDYTTPRLYTVRILREDASVDDIGGFQAYKTLRAARKAAREVE